MTTYIIDRPVSSITTMKFTSYNAAVAFSQNSGMLNPSKPYKRMLQRGGDIVPVWCVTLPNRSAVRSKPSYRVVDVVPSKVDLEIARIFEETFAKLEIMRHNVVSESEVSEA